MKLEVDVQISASEYTVSVSPKPPSFASQEDKEIYKAVKHHCENAARQLNHKPIRPPDIEGPELVCCGCNNSLSKCDCEQLSTMHMGGPSWSAIVISILITIIIYLLMSKAGVTQ